MDLRPLSQRRDPRWPASLLGAVTACVLGWWAFVHEERVPLLGWADLGIHEFGHLLFQPAPDLITVLMGNGLQTAAPLLCAGYFALRQHNWPAAGVCLAWAGTTLKDASIYITDAPYQALPLLYANGTHDWAYILGPEQFDRLESAGALAGTVQAAGLALVAAGLGLCLVPAVLRQRRQKRASAPLLDLS